MESLQVSKTVMARLAVVAVAVGQEGSGVGLPAGHEDILSNPYDPESFSCEGQDYGYYADVASGCEIFHICLPIQDNEGIPGQEELGTADSLRRVSDRLTGSDILVVSGDLIMDSEGLRGLTDMHRLNRAALTSLLGQGQSMEGVVVPGSKSTKYKRERDLVGLSGDQMCLFTAEADVEETVRVPPKVLASHPRITVHSGLQDCHLYIMKRWILDYIVADKNISTVKGELMPVVVRKQFSSSTSNPGQISVGDFLPPQSPWEVQSKTRFPFIGWPTKELLLLCLKKLVPLLLGQGLRLVRGRS